MMRSRVNGLTDGYEVIGDGRPWVLTPGGRDGRDTPGLFVRWPLLTPAMAEWADEAVPVTPA